MALIRNFIVRRRSARELFTRAEEMRNKALEKYGDRFDVTRVIERLSIEVNGVDNPISIELASSDEFLEAPAIANLDTYKMDVYGTIWEAAKNGLADARFVIAHELAHFVLHNKAETGFTPISDERSISDDPYSTSEFQANLFAAFFLVGEKALKRTTDPRVIEIIANVDYEVAELACRIFDQEIKQRVSVLKFEGEACPECANFTLVRNGTCLKCDTCGSTTGCS